jgi:putative membrane protein
MSENSSTDLAEDRTDWAEDRTILANERTFAGWMRTGMAALAVAIGLKAVFGPFEPTWAAKLVASIFIAAAIYIFWAAHDAATKTLQRLNDHHAHAQPNGRMKVISIIFSIASVGIGAILWML